WVEMLSEGEAGARGADLADGMRAIGDSATSLTQLISDLLDLSRIQRGVLRLHRDLLDVNELVRTAERTVRQTARARGQELRLELSERLPPTIADAQRLQQILWNLMTNAVKFTPKGGRVTVRTRLREGEVDGAGPGARWVEVEVEDTGEGIPEDFMPHIWERFRQADATATRRHGGLGIGLSLVKELVEAHGGRIEAASEEGQGSRFTVRLPVIKLEELQGAEA
ncbi:MAG TPA: ATP-binding protein, partial [Pyrinomonadaceae bacterium]